MGLENQCALMTNVCLSEKMDEKLLVELWEVLHLCSCIWIKMFQGHAEDVLVVLSVFSPLLLF